MIIPVLHQVILPLGPQFSDLATTLLAFVGDVVVVGRHFRADEALLEVGMDHAGGAGRLPALLDLPGPDLLDPAVK